MAPRLDPVGRPSPHGTPCAATTTTATSSSTCAPLNQHITKEDSLALGLEELVLFEGELGVARLEGVHLGGERRHVAAARGERSPDLLGALAHVSQLLADGLEALLWEEGRLRGVAGGLCAALAG